MIYLAGDHLATELVDEVSRYLSSQNIEFENLGSQSPDDMKTLQEIIPAVCEQVKAGASTTGILICGTGAGVEIGANRFKKIRASLCTQPKQAEYAKVYDAANVLCLGSWLTTDPSGILNAWLNNEFDGDPGRTQMIKDFDAWN